MNKILIAIISFVLTLGIAEIFFRCVDFNFSQDQEAWKQVPPFYRQPTLAFGDVFFRRPGPEVWTGQVLNTRLTQLGLSPNPYKDEAVISVEYDENGFRNSGNYSEWKIVIAGDSFTELGHLPFNEIFTTLLSQMSNHTVGNLGVSYTGPLTQLSYIREFGLGPAVEKIAIVFFEGNDLSDLNKEYKALMRFRQGGKREHRDFVRQSSPVKALYELGKNKIENTLRKPPVVDAAFMSAEGPIELTVGLPSPDPASFGPEQINQLRFFFSEYSELKKVHSAELWLVFMPCKLRATFGQLQFVESTPKEARDWSPNSLPQFLENLSQEYSIRYIDLTPALTSSTQATNKLLYSSIYDTHLNAGGAVVVANELAKAFGY